MAQLVIKVTTASAVKNVSNLGKSFDKLDKDVSQSTKKVKTFGASLKGIGQALTSLPGLLAGGGIAFGLTQLVKVADAYTNINSRLKLVADSTEELTFVQKELFDISQETGTLFRANAGSYAKLGLALESLNVPTSELLNISELLNKSLIVSGASSEEATSFMLQYTQALSSGVLAGEEFRAMTESNSYFASQLATALGVTRGELKKLSRDQKLTTDVLREAMSKMSTEVAKDFVGMEKTVARAMNELRNQFEKSIDIINDMEDATGSLASAFSGLTSVVAALPRAWALMMGLWQGLNSAFVKSIILVTEWGLKFQTAILDVSMTIDSIPFIGDKLIPDADITRGQKRVKEMTDGLKAWKSVLDDIEAKGETYATIFGGGAIPSKDKPFRRDKKAGGIAGTPQADLKQQAQDAKALNDIWLASLNEQERAITRVRQGFDSYRDTLDDLQSSGAIGLNEMVDLWEQLNIQEEETLTTLVSGWLNAGKEAEKTLTQVQTISETAAGRLEDGFVQAFDSITQGFDDLEDIAMDVLRSIANEIFRVTIAQQAAAGIAGGISGLFSNAGTGLGSGSTPVSLTQVNDAVIKPDGKVISTHPDDYLIATKDPSSLMGGKGGGQATVNIYNQGEQKDARVEQSFDLNGMVIDIWLNDFNQNGPTRQVLQGGL